MLSVVGFWLVGYSFVMAVPFRTRFLLGNRKVIYQWDLVAKRQKLLVEHLFSRGKHVHLYAFGATTFTNVLLFIKAKKPPEGGLKLERCI